ncbi:MAG: YkgJ family cysteine cluster protein [Microcoleaceae cyanobacterium]
MNLDVTNSLTDLYTKIDEDIAVFQAKTKLHCPPGCGWCCLNPDVETTILEILPVALELFRRGEVEVWLEQAKASNEQGRCIFYQPDPVIDGNGRCQVYPWRPTICRLFAFATTTNKSGQKQLAACVRHKKAMPEIVAQVEEALAVGSIDALNFSDVAQQVTNIDPTLAQQRLPISEAFKVAVEKVGLYLQMSAL